MLASGDDVVAGRKFLDELDIGSQPGAGEDALVEIVAQQRVAGNPAFQGDFEGVYVVDALPGV